MSKLQVVQMDSVTQLRALAAPWDQLWRRSEVTSPAVRAELIAQWMEQFRPEGQFRAVAVQQQDRLVAALPLVGRRIGPWWVAGGLPSNEWSASGDLLLDRQADSAVLDLLVDALDALPWTVFWLDLVSIDEPRWQALMAALIRHGLAVEYHQRFRIGLIEICGSWDEYRRLWSKNHRRNMKRAIRRLEQRGQLALRLERPLDPRQVEPLMWRGLQVEDRNWKGATDSSILRSPGMPRFYCRQAEQLARWGQLLLAFLELDGRPIAFEYGWLAKGVYHSVKVGYDEQFAAFSPGQVLMYRLLERFYMEGSVEAVDCMGPLSAAVGKWRPASRGVGRLVVAPRRPVGQTLLWGYKNVWRPWRQLRCPPETSDEKARAATTPAGSPSCASP